MRKTMLILILAICAFRFNALAEEYYVAGESAAFDLNLREVDSAWMTGAAIHYGGAMTNDETWVAGSVHVVYGSIVVATNVTLTIEPGAVVKFIGGGLYAAGTCIARGVTFTDIADGNGLAIPSYEVKGNVETDGATRIRFAKSYDEIVADGESNVLAFSLRTDAEVPDGAVEHGGGTLTSDETWSAGSVHVVYGSIVVATNVTLTIEPGAVVKFIGGGLYAAGTCVARGVTFTDIADGNGLAVPSYEVKGNVETDGATRIRFAKSYDEIVADGESNVLAFSLRTDAEVPDGAVEHGGGTLTSDETWSAGSVHVVYGSIVVATNVTLTIEPGAVVKFIGGGLYAAGTCVARGVTFTDIADGNGLAVPSYVVKGNFETDGATRIRFAKTGDEIVADGVSNVLAFNLRTDAEVPDGAVEHGGGTLTSDETWAAGSVHVVYGSIVVATNVTLTIEPGAVVKFIGGGLYAAGTCVARGVTFTDIADGNGLAVPSYVVKGNFETDEATRIRFAKTGDEIARMGDSGAFSIDINEDGYRLAHEEEQISFSTHWTDGSGVKVTVTKPDGGVETLVDEAGTAEGFASWAKPSGMGLYEFRHESGGEVLTARFAVVAGVVHDGTLDGNETWENGKVHIVGGNMTVADGATLTIEPGAVVKFLDGKTLTVAAGGACVAEGVIFTSIADDTVGGDTLNDGAATEPVTNGYAIVGFVKDDLATEYRYGVQSYSGTLVGEVTWYKEKTYVIDGSLTVATNGVLTIPAGTVVKFAEGSEIKVADGGMCVAEGVIFTHIADDTVGGDTMGDGDETKPTYGAYSVDVAVLDNDETEYRYSAPISTSGTISGNVTWRARQVYRVTGDLTLADGATLSIAPGSVVKFDPNVSLTVNSGATLNAPGTRSAPIIFTSIKDDEHGGDTNEDGDATKPNPGDWVKICVNGGTANFNYAKILYSSKNATTGAINMTSSGGNVVFVNGEIAHTAYDAIGVESGNCYVTNSVIHDCLLAFRHWTRDPIVNCVIYDCGRLTQGGGQHFYNCIFSHITETWEAFGFPQNGTTYNNCCFWNEDGSILTAEGNQDALTVCGKDGNIWANPKFVDPENGDFRIAADSLCVDAGDATVAPAEDWYGQPRYAINGLTPAGTPDANGAYADIGIHELQPRYAGADVDFEAMAVAMPNNFTIGEKVLVTWRVRNMGSSTAQGEWEDRLDLVAANGAVVTLGTVKIRKALEPDGEYVLSKEFTVPSISEGACAIRLTANHLRDIYEGSLTGNNVCLSDEATVSVASIDFGENATVRVNLLSGRQVSYKLTGLPTGGSSLLIHSASGETFGAYVSFGKIPTTYASATSFVKLPNGDVLVSVPPNSGDEAAYLMLDTKGSVTDSLLEVTISENYPAIYALSRESMPNTGSQSMTIYGVGMGIVRGASLVAVDGSVIGASSIRAANACELSAAFVLDGAKTGAYRIEITSNTDAVATSAGTVSIVPHGGAKAHLDISLEYPSAVRRGRWYALTVVVRNMGDVDAPAPLVAVNGEGLAFKDPDGGNAEYSEMIHALVLGNEANPLVIVPGETASIQLMFKTVRERSDNSIYYRLLEKHDADWSSLITQGDLSDSDWNAYFTKYTAGYANAEAFLDGVFAKAAEISTTGLRPANAFRLCELVQKEKSGLQYGMVSGVVLDENHQPCSGLDIEISSDSSDETVHVKTDVNGWFAAYSVPTGCLMFAESGATLCAEPKVRLETGVIETVLYHFEGYENLDEKADEIKEIATVENLRWLPGNDGRMAWLDGGELYVANSSGGDKVQKMSFGTPLTSFEVSSLDDDTYMFFGTTMANETNSLCAFTCDASEGKLVNSVLTVFDGTEGAYGVSFTDNGDATYEVGYSRKPSQEDLPTLYKMRIRMSAVNQTAMAALSMNAAATVSNTVAKASRLKEGSGFTLALPTIGFSKWGFDASISAYVKDAHMPTQGKQIAHCKWEDSMAGGEIGADLTFGGKKVKWLKGGTIDFGASGHYDSKTVYRCAKYCGVEPYSCDYEHRSAVSGRTKWNFDVHGGVTFPLDALLPAGKIKTFLEMASSTRGYAADKRRELWHQNKTEKEKFLPEYEELIKLPDLNLSIPITLKVHYNRDVESKWKNMIDESGKRCSRTFEDTDSWSAGYEGSGSISGNIGSKQVDAQKKGVLRKGKNAFLEFDSISMEVMNIGVSVGLDFGSHKTTTEHGVYKNSIWAKNHITVDCRMVNNVGVSFSGSCDSETGKWTTSVSYKTLTGIEDEISKNANRKIFKDARLKSLGSSQAEEPFELVTPEDFSNGIATYGWGVMACKAGAETIMSWCGRYIESGLVKSGLYFLRNYGKPELITSADYGMFAHKPVVIGNDLHGYVLLASRPQLSGTLEDRFAAEARTHLYWLPVNVDGTVGSIVPLCDGGVASMSSMISVAATENGVGMAWRETSLGLGNVVEADHLYTASYDAMLRRWNAPEHVVVIEDCNLGGVAYSYENAQPTIAFSLLHNDGEDEILSNRANDSLHVASFANGNWNVMNVDITNVVSRMQTASMLAADSSSNEHDEVVVKEKVAASTPRLLYSGGSENCGPGCNCGCYIPPPTPPTGCLCDASCSCKRKCGTNCTCGKNTGGKPPTGDSKDPNEMVGPVGVGDARYVKPGETMDYTIYFENMTNATAAAQDIYVTLPKDTGLDWSTFELGEVVFGDNIDTTLSGFYEGESSYAIPGTNWSVRTVVTHAADAVKWHLRIIDPTTPDNYPSDAYAGFLPPNDETGRGEGHLRFRVKVKNSAVVGSRINASATIVFDYNDPITTDPAWWNTVGQEIGVTIGDGEDGVLTQLFIGAPYGDALPEGPAKDKPGYTFGGWYTGPNGTGRRVTAQSLVEAGDGTLYAHWLAYAYNVHFDANGGDGQMSDQAFNVDEPGALDTNAFTFACHDFGGWATNETGEAVYADGAVVTNLTTVSNGVFNLYATWQRRMHMVSIYGDAELTQPLESRTVGEGLPLGLLPDAPDAAAGYSFLGWRGEAGASVDAETVVENDMAVYAAYQANTYIVSFDANGGVGSVANELDYASEIIVPEVSREGYMFAGWSPEVAETVPASNVTYTAQWNVNQYTVTFNTNGGEGEMPPLGGTYGLVSSLSSNVLTRTSHRFLGWATNATGAVVYADGAAVSNLTAVAGGSVTLYAVWELMTVEVAFDAQGGSPEPANRIYVLEVPYGELPEVSRAGYAFAGWYVGPNGTGRRVTAQEIVDAEAATFYAYWLPHAYVVHFNANEGEGTMSDEAFEIDKPGALDANAFTRAYHDFMGWATNGTGEVIYADGAVVSNLSAGADGVVQLFATWQRRKVSVSLADGVDAVVTQFEVGLPYGELPEPAARGAYTFGGWFTAPDGGGREITPESIVEPGDEALYALWCLPSLWDDVTGTAPTAAVSTYDGYLYNKDNGNVVGTIQVKVGKPGKDGLAAVKATVVGLDGKKKSLKASEKGKAPISSGGPTTVPLVGGEACEVILGAYGMSGKYGVYTIDGSLNVFASKAAADKAVAAAALGRWQGAVNMAWRSDATERVPPFNTLSVTIAAKGKAKVAGTLGDGAKVSAKGQLIVGEKLCCVPVVYAKKGVNLAFTLWLPRDGAAVATSSATPAAVGLGEGVKVGKPGTLKAGAEFHIDADAFSAMWKQTALPHLPNGVAVTGGAKWVLPKAGKVVYEKGTTTVDPTKTGDNPSGLKLAYNAKNGTFKGSFKAYADVNGKPKATAVNVVGVLVDGVGYGAATIKKVGGVPVTVK